MSKSGSYLKIAAGLYFCLSSWGIVNEVMKAPLGDPGECNVVAWPACLAQSHAALLWYLSWAFGLASIALGLIGYFRGCRGKCKCCGDRCCGEAAGEPEGGATAPKR